MISLPDHLAEANVLQRANFQGTSACSPWGLSPLCDELLALLLCMLPLGMGRHLSMHLCTLTMLTSTRDNSR